MFVKFKTNLGANDARRAKLKFEQCVKGAEVECNDESGKWLVAKGMAEVVAVAKPAALQAVPPPRAEHNKPKTNKDS
jgi:hypothetical protein